MNMIKKALCLFLVTLLAIGVCGCMNHEDQNAKMSNMKEIIEQRYNEKFTIEYFQPAKDKLGTDILTLSTEKGIIFNAYKTINNSFISDDYSEAILNSKLKEYIVSVANIPEKLNIYLLGIVKDGSKLNADYARNYVVSTICNDFGKLIAIISLEGEITEYKSELFKIYSEMLKFNPDLIEFEVIYTKKPSDELSKSLNNPLGYYNNNWENFNCIESYLDIREKNIRSMEDLVKGVK